MTWKWSCKPAGTAGAGMTVRASHAAILRVHAAASPGLRRPPQASASIVAAIAAEAAATPVELRPNSPAKARIAASYAGPFGELEIFFNRIGLGASQPFLPRALPEWSVDGYQYLPRYVNGPQIGSQTGP